MKYLVTNAKYENVEGSFMWPFLNGVGEVEIDIQCDFSLFPAGPVTFFSNVTSCKIKTNGHRCILSGNGLLFKDMEYVSVEGMKFKDYAGDGIQLNNVKEYSIRHNTFEGHIPTSDEAISSVKGAGSIKGEIAWNLFDGVNKGILCGTGDATDSNLDKVQRVFIHHNWFKNFERRAPYCREGIFCVYNNVFENWKFHDTQTFCIWAEDNANVFVLSNSFIQDKYSWFDGFPKRQMSWLTKRPWSMDQGTVSRFGAVVYLKDNCKNKDWIRLDGISGPPTVSFDGYELYSDSMIASVKAYAGSNTSS